MTTEIAKPTRLQIALEKIDLELKALKDVESRAFRTNGQFRFNPGYTGNAAIDIPRTKDIELLISVYSYLMVKDNQYNQAAEELGLSEYPVFKWQGYTWEAWKNDLQLRIDVVAHHEKREKLNKAKQQLSTFLTEEDRLEMTLKNLGF